jgi:7-cyano-7-deazaguanine synthase
MPRCAVLLSGGLDSAVLLAHEIHSGSTALPVHVRSGFAWEDAEATAIARLLFAAPFVGRCEASVTIAVDMRDVFPSSHWAVRGSAPAYDTPDEGVYLEGRNLTLLSKAAILCARRAIPRIVLGPLAGNPFPDARPEFFEALARALSLGLDCELSVAAPFVTMTKGGVVGLGQRLGVPLHLTLSCMSPVDGKHCGRCSKCRERQDAFLAAGVEDPTSYADAWTGPRGSKLLR